MKGLWHRSFADNLDRKRLQSGYRTLTRIDGREGMRIRHQDRQWINFASNDYLGLCSRPSVQSAGVRAAKGYGSGSGASRLITGTFDICEELERDIAEWTGRERALLFNSGYHANIGILDCLADSQTVIFCDKLDHASIYDGVRMSSATMVRFRHRDMDHLRRMILRHPRKKRIIVTDAVFSMDGDIAPLPELSEISDESGALLIVDEAHSIGIHGLDGSGLCRDASLADHVDIVIGTMGKALGVFGAFAAADALIIDYLINNARPFIFTTALPPFVAGALRESIRLIRGNDPGKKLLQSARMLRDRISGLGYHIGSSETQIIPLIVGSNAQALSLMDHLLRHGIFAPAIRPPTVPAGGARVRISLSTAHTTEEINQLISALEQWPGTKNNTG